MTKAELIKLLQELPCPDNWEVSIVKLQWIPGADYAVEEEGKADGVFILDEGKIGIEFRCDDFPNTDDELE